MFCVFLEYVIYLVLDFLHQGVEMKNGMGQQVRARLLVSHVSLHLDISIFEPNAQE
jgi:hypothetical protein